MSVRIPRDSLNDIQKKRLASNLTFQPKGNFMTEKMGISPGDPVFMYTVDGDEVIIPYTFATKLTGGLSNISLEYPRAYMKFTGSLRNHQTSIVDEAKVQLNTYGTTLLNLYTGCGKTIMAAYLACGARYVTVVLINATVLNPQWLSTFKDHTNATIWVVGETQPEDIPDVIISMSGRVGKIPEFMRKAVGTVIIDESHKFCTPSSVGPLLRFQPRFVIACSATPKREDGMHRMIESIIGTHEVYRPLDKPFTVTYFRTGIKPVLEQTKQGIMNWSACVKSLSEDPTRNHYIVETVMANQDSKILILTWQTAHVIILQKMLEARGVKVAVMMKNTKKYSDSQVLIGTVQKIGTGFDEATTCGDFGGVRINMLLLVGSTKSDTLLFQLAGRAFRAAMPHIVDFVDDVPCIAKRHWPVRRKWYEENGGTITELCGPGVTPTKTRKKAVQSKGASSNKGDKVEEKAIPAHLASVRAKYLSK